MDRPRATLVGVRQALSAGASTTAALWGRFMPRRHEIAHRVDERLISLRVYHAVPPSALAASTPFDEWAVAEVSEAGRVPSGMEALELRAGLYAVFVHRGPAAAFAATARWIYGTWLPASAYALDGRPHLAVMGPGYRPDDPLAEEEVWIPVTPSP